MRGCSTRWVTASVRRQVALPIVSRVLEWRTGRSTSDLGDPASFGEAPYLDAGVVGLQTPPGWYLRLWKRWVDVVGASVLLAVLSPILVGVWCALRLSLGRNVVLRQQRVGRSGRVYSCLKYRTMAPCRRESGQRGRADACGLHRSTYDGPDRRRTHKSDDDPRHTTLGRFLRRHSLDEVLQLFNVIRGDMSLVGPRPELASVASESFVKHRRHSVRPGLTGPYQVSDHRTRGRLTDALEFDESYVDSISLVTDVKLLMATISPVARGAGS